MGQWLVETSHYLGKFAPRKWPQKEMIRRYIYMKAFVYIVENRRSKHIRLPGRPPCGSTWLGVSVGKWWRNRYIYPPAQILAEVKCREFLRIFTNKEIYSEGSEVAGTGKNKTKISEEATDRRWIDWFHQLLTSLLVYKYVWWLLLRMDVSWD